MYYYSNITNIKKNISSQFAAAIYVPMGQQCQDFQIAGTIGVVIN